MNKNVLITGGSQGLGADIAQHLARDGYRIFLNFSRSVDKAEAVARDIVSLGGSVEIIQADVSDPAAVDDMFARLALRDGVDVLVNNARVAPHCRPPEMNASDWFDLMIGVNLKGAYLCSLAALGQMMHKGWGRIVNISSVWAYRAADQAMMEYAMSKAGMHSLTRSLAEIAGPAGVTVNTVAPGLIITEGLARRWTREKFNDVCAAIPVRRGARTEEIVDAVKFIIANGYLNGETLNINGGTYMP